MPKEIFSADEFKNLLKNATEVRMKPAKDSVKLKVKTNNYLNTYIAKPQEADQLWRDVKIQKVEIK